MRLIKKWDVYYTDAKSGKEGYVDSLTIDHFNKRYILDVDVYAGEENVEDGMLYPNYVSVLEFINMLQKIKENNYNKIN